jgi:hypothetical protein
MFGILCTPAIPTPHLTIGIAHHPWLPNPSL